MSAETVWLICYEERDDMDSNYWRKREEYVSGDLDDAKRMYAIYRYSRECPDFRRNVRLREVKLCDLDIPIERL